VSKCVVSTNSALEWLSEPLLQKRTIRSTDTYHTTISQGDVEFAVRDGVELDDAVNVDDRGTMDANEAVGVETRGELSQCRAIQQ